MSTTRTAPTSTTPSLFLAPAVRGAAKAHFERTVEQPVSADMYHNQTEKRFGESVYMWGVREGNARFWRQMEKGDFLLFYSEPGLYTLGARVLATEQNPEFADLVFDQGDGTFPYLIYLTTPVRLDLPSAHLHELLGFERDHAYNFTRVRDENLETIRAEYGSLSAYFNETRQAGPHTPRDELDEAKTELEEATRTEPSLEEPAETTEEERRIRSDAFREAVREHYDSRCAVCGVRRVSPTGNPEVEAAHIYPKSEDGPDDVRNGIALCRLHHWAFDVGWLSITNDFRLLVRDKEEREGYDEFAPLKGRELEYLPDERRHQPHPKFLEQHREIHGFPHRVDFDD